MYMYMYVLFIPMRWNVAVKWVSPLLHIQCVSIQISANEKGMGVACTNYRDPAVRKGAWGPTVLHMLLSFSVVSLFVHCTN
jgi:hypothetical protein